MFLNIFTCLSPLSYQEYKSAINKIKKIHKEKKIWEQDAEFFSEHCILKYQWVNMMDANSYLLLRDKGV